MKKKPTEKKETAGEGHHEDQTGGRVLEKRKVLHSRLGKKPQVRNVHELNGDREDGVITFVQRTGARAGTEGEENRDRGNSGNSGWKALAIKLEV